ncbi:MAG TPA: hypothetical protein VIX12_02120 [Candidatus Binataceae bacterium]
MLTKIVVVLALTSLAAVALRYVSEAEDAASLEREVARQLEALREHLFRR